MSSIFLKVLDELSFPEYRARHIFTAKLRLAIFIGFWFLYVVFLNDHLSETIPVTIAILISFFLTAVCYYNIFNEKYLVPSFVVEIFSDLLALTAIVYLTGGPESEYYIIYVFYTIVAGLFYNYRLALFVSLLSFLSYSIFLFFYYEQIIPPLFLGYGSFMAIEFHPPYFHLLLLGLFLALSVYATKIAHYFTQIRERMLEEKNKELLALQQMSSTIRTVTSLQTVLAQVLNGVLKGLDLSMCLLMLQDKREKIVKCIPPEGHPQVLEIEKILGIKLNEIYFPVKAIAGNPAMMQVQQGRIIFRKDITEIVSGLEPKISTAQFDEVQARLGVKRVIAIPLVTGREVIGSLIGFASEPFVEASKINTFQAFADQASLTIEAAIMIAELRQKNIALVEANRVKSEFLATMSHELRTPLTAIIGFSELLIENVMGPLSDEQQDSLKEVLNNGNNLLEMINNLLDLAKMDSGKMELNKNKFNWVEMLRRIERSVAPLIQRKGHTLKLEIPDELPFVLADEKRIQQIVLNLLGNAIKFTPDNGAITIKTEMFVSLAELAKSHSYGRVSVDRSFYKNGLIMCSVEDNGIGIAKDDIAKIFDVFQQVDSSSTRSYEGSGLGLALVKQFVELHNGFVWVESQEGSGAKFSFVIPHV